MREFRIVVTDEELRRSDDIQVSNPQLLPSVTDFVRRSFADLYDTLDLQRYKVASILNTERNPSNDSYTVTLACYIGRKSSTLSYLDRKCMPEYLYLDDSSCAVFNPLGSVDLEFSKGDSFCSTEYVKFLPTSHDLADIFFRLSN